MSHKFPAIVCTELVLSGSPGIDGRRLAVGDVVYLLEGCENLEEAVNEYKLEIYEIRQALEYCSLLQCKVDMPAVFCHNCSLRREQEGPLNTSGFEQVTSDNSVFVVGDKSIFLGSMGEMLDEWSGKDRWKMAAELLLDLRDQLF